MDVNTYFKQTGIDFIDLYEVPSNCSNKITTTHVPEVHRVLIKAPIDYVCDLHDKGKSLEHFDESNLRFEDGSWEVCGVKVKDSLSSEDRRRDYKCLHDFIEKLIWDHNPHNYRCEILDDLLYLLKNSVYRESCDVLLRGHLVLLSHDTSLQLTKSYSDNISFIKDVEHRRRYFEAANKMKRIKVNLGDWTDRFDGSEPGLGPAQDCFDFVPDGKKPYKGTNLGILKFSRNMAGHLKDHIGKYTTSEFSEKDVDLTIMALFQTEILSFHKLILLYGISSYFIRGQEKTLRSAGQDTTGSYGGLRNQGATQSTYSGSTQTSGPRQI